MSIEMFKIFAPNDNYAFHYVKCAKKIFPLFSKPFQS